MYAIGCSNRDLYRHYLKETIIIPDEGNSVDDDHVRYYLYCCLSHQSAMLTQPLNPNPESSWNKYFQDNETLLQIDHDARYRDKSSIFCSHRRSYHKSCDLCFVVC